MKRKIGEAAFALGFSMMFLGGAYVETALGFALVIISMAVMVAAGLYLDNI